MPKMSRFQGDEGRTASDGDWNKDQSANCSKIVISVNAHIKRFAKIVIFKDEGQSGIDELQVKDIRGRRCSP
jgi:hypothetical protein